MSRSEPGEIYPLETATRVFPFRENAVDTHGAVSVHYYSLAGKEFLDIVDLKIESGLYHRSFAGYDHNLVILVVESGSYAMRIPHRPHVAVADNAAYHVSSVPRGCAAFEDIGDIEVACYGVGKVTP